MTDRATPNADSSPTQTGASSPAATERAREIADRSIDARVCCDKYPPCQTELWRIALALDIAEFATAAASEARAAERIATIEECAQWIRESKGGWPTGAGDSDEWTLDDVADELLRTLATPAQSPGQKVIAGLEEALAHAKGETAVPYACGHWHNSFKEAQECRRVTPAQSDT